MNKELVKIRGDSRICIRPMVESDVGPLARLMAQTPLRQRYGLPEESAARRFRDGLARGATIAVAEVGGEPAGFIWYVARGAFNRSARWRSLSGDQRNRVDAGAQHRPPGRAGRLIA